VIDSLPAINSTVPILYKQLLPPKRRAAEAVGACLWLLFVCPRRCPGREATFYWDLARRRTIEATKDKLDEARFFLGHMRAEAAKVVKQHPEAFGHYFSAFITAARSVPWVLQCEQQENYLVWRNIWNAAKTDEERELENFTNERRLDEVKRNGAETAVTWEEVSIFKLSCGVALPPGGFGCSPAESMRSQ
jgi:hypothetical protein